MPPQWVISETELSVTRKIIAKPLLTVMAWGNFRSLRASFPGSDFSQIAGHEIFRLYALPDGEIAEQELSSAQVQIWPIAKGTFSGVDPNSSYNIAPDVQVDLTSLYPGSETWVQYYPGPYQAGTEGTPLPMASLWATETPRNAQWPLIDLDPILLDTGTWTLEVLTRTPFGVDPVANVTFNIDRNLQLRGSFQTLTD